MEQFKEIQEEIKKADEVLEKEVTAFGNSCHIAVPLRHKGKMARVIIKGGYHPCDKCGSPVYGRYTSRCKKCIDKGNSKAGIYGRSLLIVSLKDKLADESLELEERVYARKCLKEILEGTYIYGDEKDFKELGIIPQLDKESLKEIKDLLEKHKLNKEAKK